jgi:hypothetical protein
MLFVGYLNELPLADRVEVVRRRPLIRGMPDAERDLRIAVRELGHESDVFSVKDGVPEALQRFESSDGRHLTRTRSVTDHLRQASEHSGFAVLARSRLSIEAFETLYEPSRLRFRSRWSSEYPDEWLVRALDDGFPQVGRRRLPFRGMVPGAENRKFVSRGSIRATAFVSGNVHTDAAVPA